MGYTHYWYRPANIQPDKFKAIGRDIITLVNRFQKYSLPLGDGWGKNKPIITQDLIEFNGRVDCGHETKNLGITWPAPKNLKQEDCHTGPVLGEMLAKEFGSEHVLTVPSDEIESEGYPKWFAGAYLKQRECGGDCSHEPFTFPIAETQNSWRQDEPLVFAFTKTAFKPYDLAVTAALIVVKHYVPEVIVHSDGESHNWDDARMVCMEWLGYGSDFQIDTD